jgi:AraC-like DNA-binding protein
MATGARRPAANRQDNARLWQADAFGGLELLRAQFVAFNFSPHAHEEFMIVVTEAGAALPRFWGAVQRVGPGDVFVLSPGEVHGGGPARESIWCYRSFYPPAALMQRVVRELTGVDSGVPQFAEDVVNDPATAATLRRAHLALEEPGSALAREACLLEALAGLVARHGVGKVSAQRIGREHRSEQLAQEYLEALPGENVSLETLAQAAGIGPFHLCRVFRQETGLSPHAYQILVRVRLAKALLARGIPIAQVAVDAGFSDQAHLTRHFKRTFGVTPGRYAGRVLQTTSWLA